MHWARIELDGQPSFGIVAGDTVEKATGDLFAGSSDTGKNIRMEAARRGAHPVVPAKPDVGYRTINALIGHGAPIVLPADATD